MLGGEPSANQSCGLCDSYGAEGHQLQATCGLVRGVPCDRDRRQERKKLFQGHGREAGGCFGPRHHRVGIVAAQRGKEIISPLVYTGTMDSSLFEYWFEKQLLPALPSDAVIVMDNASFHRRAQLINVAQKQGLRLIFLPPYSPEFNPIENFWAWLKCYLRSTLAHFSNFDDALFDAFQVR